MSYARMGLDGSDVYVIATDEGLQCVWCKFNDQDSMEFPTGEGAIAHLMKHNESGDNVPQNAIDRIAEDYGVEDVPKVNVYKKKRVRVSKKPPSLEVNIRAKKNKKIVREWGIGVYLTDKETAPARIDALAKSVSRFLEKNKEGFVKYV